jgi:hypothetical protein
MAFVARVAQHPSNWMVHSTCLLYRSRLESKKYRTAERAVLQLQVRCCFHGALMGKERGDGRGLCLNVNSLLQVLLEQWDDKDAPVAERMKCIRLMHFDSCLTPLCRCLLRRVSFSLGAATGAGREVCVSFCLSLFLLSLSLSLSPSLSLSLSLFLSLKTSLTSRIQFRCARHRRQRPRPVREARNVGGRHQVLSHHGEDSQGRGARSRGPRRATHSGAVVCPGRTHRRCVALRDGVAAVGKEIRKGAANVGMDAVETRASTFWRFSLHASSLFSHYLSLLCLYVPSSFPRSWSRSRAHFCGLLFHWLIILSSQFAECIPHFELALALNTLMQGAWFSYGCAALRVQDYDKAQKGFSRSVTLEPDVSETRLPCVLSLFFRFGSLFFQLTSIS